MKTPLLAWLILATLFSCKPAANTSGKEPDSIVLQSGDKEILEQVLDLYAGEKEAPISDLMVKVGTFFLETPYVAHTLEEGEEQLIINLQALDCTTFAENCLAISRTLKSEDQSFERFTAELQGIRYRDGNIEGYPSRLHYFCDWIYNNQQKKLIMDMSEELAQTSFPKEINFMSTHPDSYRQLKADSTLVGVLAAQEREISARTMHYIPETLIAQVEDKLMDGDIAGISTSIEGLAIQHVVILVRKEGRIHMLHASSKAEKVELSDMTLEAYLLNNKSTNGIMLARPL